MAFVRISPFQLRTRNDLPRAKSTRRPRNHTTPRACEKRWDSIGNGGINNVADFSKFNEEEFLAEVAEAEKAMKDSPEEVDLVSKWVVIMSADVIQFRNNLLETSIRDGHNWDLSDVSVIRMAERTARRALPPTTTKLWVVRVGESGNGQEVVSVGVEGNGRREDVLLAFEREDEAKRFAEYLIADGTAATHTHEPITRLNAVCNEAKILLGLVPAETLITPGQFKRS